MKFGLEARWLTRGSESGRVVLEGLTPELLRLAQRDGDKLLLYVDRRDQNAAALRAIAEAGAGIRPLFFGNRLITVGLALGAACDHDGVDVIVSQMFTPLRCRARRVAYIHDILFESHPQFFTPAERLYCRFVRASCARADRVVAVSHFTRSELLRYGYAPQERIEVVYSGVTPRRPLPSGASPPFDLPTRYFLYVGRLSKRKNLDTVFCAFAQALPDLPDVHLLLAGRPYGGWRAGEYLQDPALRERVRFLGYVDDAHLPLLYGSALALVYVPLVEGFGLPVLEAMAHGTPVIVSRGSGLDEASGRCGLTVDPLSVNDVAGAMRRLQASGALREELSESGRRHAARFTWREAAHRLWALCKGLTASREHS